MRYRLRTLMIVLAMGPPILAVCWFHPLPVAVPLVGIIGTLAFAALSVVVCAALCWLIDIPITLIERRFGPFR
jgi:hypothetical protein